MKSFLLASTTLALALNAHAQTPPVDAPQVVTAIEQTFGVTPGERRNHTKGLCAVGEFLGDPDVARYSRSPLFSGHSLPVIARFSLSGGNPKAPDTAKSARGMAFQVQLPGGKLQHFAMLNVPIFGAAQPQTFLDLMQALRPDPSSGKPDPEKIRAFKASHPDNLAQADFLAKNNPPASYASSAYWGIHTFFFVDRKNQQTPVRWRFVPLAGEQRLSDAELATAGANFLESELIARAASGPLRWEMRVSIGEAGDPQTDPTQAWPENRREIRAGLLTITRAMPQKDGNCAAINFDPLVLADGIVPSDDPILRFRSAAYAVSFGKRLSGQ